MSDGSKKAWSVALAGTGINLALGVLYSWSTIKREFPVEWGWSDFEKSLPYTVACLVFALMMVPAGKLQDKIGPRIVASVGGALTGIGMIIAALFAESEIRLTMFVVGFGVLAGTGIGFGYASATPPAVKWFPAAKTGMIAGIVVSGFGLASVYISPLVKYLIGATSVPTAMLILGVAFLIVVILLSQLLINPPSGGDTPVSKSSAAAADGNFTATQMLKTHQFYLLWLMYAFNAGAGLLIIGQLADLVYIQTKSNAGFILVALLAIGNAGGRLLAGTLSDKLGRIRVLIAFTAFQCLLMFITPSVSSEIGGAGIFVALIVISMCIGMCYGSNLALFPSFTKDFYGLKNFGVNYGLVFTAWGAGSLMALLAGYIKDHEITVFGKLFEKGHYDLALYISGCLLVITILISFIVKKPGQPAAGPAN